MNLDEDHLSNFPLLKHYVRIGGILSNPTIGARELRLLKPGGMGPATRAVESWLGSSSRGFSHPFRSSYLSESGATTTRSTQALR